MTTIGVQTCGAAPHRGESREPVGDAQLADLHGDLLPVAWFGHSDGRQVLTDERDAMRKQNVSPVKEETQIQQK